MAYLSTPRLASVVFAMSPPSYMLRCQPYGVTHLVDWWQSYGFMSHLTQSSSFQRRSSQPISWHSTEETKSNTTKAYNVKTKQFKLKQKNTQNVKPKQTHKTKPKPTFKFKNCSCVCAYYCVQMLHIAAKNSSDNLPSYSSVTIVQTLSNGEEGVGKPCFLRNTYFIKNWTSLAESNRWELITDVLQ